MPIVPWSNDDVVYNTKEYVSLYPMLSSGTMGGSDIHICIWRPDKRQADMTYSAIFVFSA